MSPDRFRANITGVGVLIPCEASVGAAARFLFVLMLHQNIGLQVQIGYQNWQWNHDNVHELTVGGGPRGILEVNVLRLGLGVDFLYQRADVVAGGEPTNEFVTYLYAILGFALGKGFYLDFNLGLEVMLNAGVEGVIGYYGLWRFVGYGGIAYAFR